MGNWDKLTPLDSALVSTGDDIIRETKVALGEALSHENSTFPGASPSTAPIFIPGIERGATGSRPTGDSLVSGRFYANTTLNVIERYNGSTWDSVATNLPAVVKAVFYQAAPPTGWTAVAVNDKFLRVVTAGGGGTGGSTGGTVAASTTLAHTHTLASHTHTITSEGTHTHNLPNDGLGGGIATETTSSASGSHDHTGTTGSNSEVTSSGIAGAFAYADMVIATKD